MALKITRADTRISLHPSATGDASVDYVLTDESDAELSKRGLLQVAVPSAVRDQLTKLVEDELRRLGKL